MVKRIEDGKGTGWLVQSHSNG